MFWRHFTKFMQKFLLFFVQLSRCCQYSSNMLVSTTTSSALGYAMPFKSKNRSCLGAFRDFHLNHPIESRNIYFCAQSRLDKGNWDFTINVISFTFKELMLFDLYDDIKTYSRPPFGSALTI